MQENSKVKIENNRVLRVVDDIKDTQKILDAINNIGELKTNIVPTKVVKAEENTIEHQYIPRIINSGELTESMTYDVNEISLKLLFAMFKEGIYSFDLLPHNFTYYQGKWILFDFGAFETNPKKVKTQLRNGFKISISAYELLKIVNRSELKHYFLNRIKNSDLKKMLPFKTWLNIFLKNRACQFFCGLKKYDKAYELLNDYLKSYSEQYIPSFDFPIENQPELFDCIDSILRQYKIETTFGVGLDFANWALHTRLDCDNFVYLDDYGICDKFYNHIYKEQCNNISTAVVYPLLQDDEISNNLNYRGLYDSYAQERFVSDAIVISNIDEFVKNTEFSYKRFCQNIRGFAKKLVLIRTDQLEETKFLYKELNEVCTNVIETNYGNFKFIIAHVNGAKEFEVSPSSLYQNDNRMTLANEHSKEIIKILNNQ